MVCKFPRKWQLKSSKHAHAAFFHVLLPGKLLTTILLPNSFDDLDLQREAILQSSLDDVAGAWYSLRSDESAWSTINRLIGFSLLPCIMAWARPC